MVPIGLAKYDFLQLVNGDLRSRQKCCRVLSWQGQQTEIPNDEKKRGRRTTPQSILQLLLLDMMRRKVSTGVLLSTDQLHGGTAYLWHCVQVTSRRRLSEDT